MVDLGLHGYDWNLDTGAPPEKRDFMGTLRLAQNRGVRIHWDKESGNSNFSYVADDGSYHEVWFLDAVSVWGQYLAILQKHAYGASFRLTQDEDASIWRFVPGDPEAFDPRGLSATWE